jgi:hypothetical protein
MSVWCATNCILQTQRNADTACNGSIRTCMYDLSLYCAYYACAIYVQEDCKGLPVVTLALQLLQAVPVHLLVPTTATAGQQSVDRRGVVAVPEALVKVLQQLVQDPDISDSMQCTVVSKLTIAATMLHTTSSLDCTLCALQVQRS